MSKETFYTRKNYSAVFFPSETFPLERSEVKLSAFSVLIESACE